MSSREPSQPPLEPEHARSRRSLLRTLAVALFLPAAGCAKRLPGWEGDPTTANQRCMRNLQRMGQLHGKPAGRC